MIVKRLLTIPILLLLFAGGVVGETDDQKLINKLLEAEAAFDKCIEAKDCKELMSSGGPMAAILYDTDLTDALNRCESYLKITKCSQIMGRLNIKAIKAIGYMR